LPYEASEIAAGRHVPLFKTNGIVSGSKSVTHIVLILTIKMISKLGIEKDLYSRSEAAVGYISILRVAGAIAV
jgi:hypothetical protein